MRHAPCRSLSVRPSAVLFLLLPWLGVIGAIAVLTAPPAAGCDGSRRPACGRSAWLAKWVERVVVHPGDDAVIEIKVGLLPYVTWNQHPSCAQPTSAVLALTLECVPDDGGAPIAFGPVAVPVAVPNALGVQAVLTGPAQAPVLGGPFCLELPAGLLPAGRNYLCDIRGEYSVTFSGGVGGAGSGTITGTGDTHVCIVESSPLDPTQPRLLMNRLNSMADAGFVTARKGDQALLYYLLANNDDTHAVVLDFETWSNQVARRPAGGTDEDTFAISSDKKGTDNFPQRFWSDLALNELLSVADIMQKGDKRIDRALVLGPGEVRIVEVAIRSHGMCANGSCSEVLAKVSGTFGDGTPALACAGTAFLVDDVAATSPLCEYLVTLAASADTDARWTRPEFDQDHMLRTHFDNTKPIAGTTIAVGGANLNSPWPEVFADTLRTEQAASSLRCQLDGYRLATGFQRDRNKITIVNLPATDFEFALPHVARGSTGSTLIVRYDAAADLLEVKLPGASKNLFQGTLAALLANPPASLLVDPATTLRVAKTGPGDAPLLGAYPGAFARLFDDASTTAPHEYVLIADQRTLAPVAWDALSSSVALQLDALSGNAGDPLGVGFDLSALPSIPEVACGYVAITNGAAMNSPLMVPFAARKAPGNVLPGLMDVSVFSAQLHPGSKKAKDKLVVRGTLTVNEAIPLKGALVSLEFGPAAYLFQLDKQGVASKKAQTLVLLSEGPGVIIGGMLQPGAVDFEVVLKKQRIANLFKDLGVFPPVLPVEGKAFELLVRVRFPGFGPASAHEALVPLIALADEGKVGVEIDAP